MHVQVNATSRMLLMGHNGLIGLAKCCSGRLCSSAVLSRFPVACTAYWGTRSKLPWFLKCMTFDTNCSLPMQILTHVKEKLQFAQKEKQALQAELDSVEGALATHRDDLTRVKVTRDKAKVATRKIRDAGSHVSNTALLADMEVST